MTDMPTPLTTAVREALDNASNLLDTLDGLASDRRNGVNDRDHYVPVADKLEELTNALLAATASTPLARREYTGARLNFGPRSDLMRALSESVDYLMNYAPDVLRGTLGPYTDGNTANARAHLDGLIGLSVASVDRYAVADLATIRKSGTGRFLTMADHLAVAAKPEPVNPDATA